MGELFTFKCVFCPSTEAWRSIHAASRLRLTKEELAAQIGWAKVGHAWYCPGCRASMPNWAKGPAADALKMGRELKAAINANPFWQPNAEPVEGCHFCLILNHRCHTYHDGVATQVERTIEFQAIAPHAIKGGVMPREVCDALLDETLRRFK